MKGLVNGSRGTPVVILVRETNNLTRREGNEVERLDVLGMESIR